MDRVSGFDCKILVGVWGSKGVQAKGSSGLAHFKVRLHKAMFAT